MLRFTKFNLATSTGSNSLLNLQNGDMRKRRVRINKEIGMWLYKKETMQRFMTWCGQQNVKARGRIRITNAQDYARCLRTTRMIEPGEAMVTAPLHTGLNFLVINRLMYETQHQFPMEINWMNWNERLRFLPGAATHDLVSAGWLCRMASLEDAKWGQFCNWLLEDTSGRDGIANGVTKERGDDNHQFDEVISHMSFDSGEEAEDYIENIFRAIACFMLRSVPVDTRVIDILRPGTNLQKLPSEELFVPTLIPLIDCCPQREDGLHSAMVEFYTTQELQTKGNGICQDLNIREEEVDENIIGEHGMYALRALEELEDGQFVTLRGWPKTPEAENENIQSRLLDQTRMQNNDLC